MKHNAFFAPFLAICILIGILACSCGYIVVSQRDFDEYTAQQNYRQAQLTKYSIQFARGEITVEEYQTYCEQINKIIETTTK